MKSKHNFISCHVDSASVLRILSKKMCTENPQKKAYHCAANITAQESGIHFHQLPFHLSPIPVYQNLKMH